MQYLHKCFFVLSTGHLSIREQKEEDSKVNSEKKYIYYRSGGEGRKGKYLEL